MTHRLAICGAAVALLAVAAGVWIPPTGQPAGTPIVTKNLVFVSTGNATYAIDLNARKQVWSHPRVVTSP